jgi:D-alanine-D-alanine ligase
MQKADALTVAVLMGGVSSERKVSLKSGKAVAEGLRAAGHEVAEWDVSERSLRRLGALAPDVAFVALHGEFGEDGQIQQMLDELAIPYTGSGPTASRLAMNKLASKRLFIRHAIPTPDYFAVGPTRDVDYAASRAAELGYPVVCKPSDSGSSIGVAIVRRPQRLAEGLALARRESETVLVERCVRGREFTVGILEGEPLPMIELVVGGEFFDYHAKYEDERTSYLTHVSLLPTLYRKARGFCLRAYEALGCRHMARVDLMYGYDGRLYVLEVNTIPGFTPRSLLPMAAARVGISFPELCDRIVRAARRDADARSRRKTA